jgi:hypothetical protein
VLRSSNAYAFVAGAVRTGPQLPRLRACSASPLVSAGRTARETHENWLEARRYLNMNDLKEHKKPNSAKPPNRPSHDRFLRIPAEDRSRGGSDSSQIKCLRGAADNALPTAS